MKKGKKIVLSALALAVAVVAVITVTFFSKLNADYPVSEKMSFAMGTVISQKLYGDVDDVYTSSVNSIINSLDDKISWRSSESLVSALNSTKSVEDAGLAAMLLDCEKVSRDSEGAFDITIGEVSQLWSIGEDDEKIPLKSDIERAVEAVDYSKIIVKGNTITYEGEGSIDLGAVGKGVACDMVKSYLDTTDLKGGVVSVGGSILAWGKRNAEGDEWKIAIRHPRNENDILGIISLPEGFVSTSGDYERYFEAEGERYHHILDAHTGYPAKSGLISVTVVCDSGILSDALSTACFILGAEKSKTLLEKYEAGAVFVSENMEIEVVGDVNFEK